jgi:hypothetical protein
MSHGEESILLAMYHANADKNQPRCRNCYDEDYKQSEDPQGCDVCYGSTFQGGVKSVARVWAMFTDQVQGEEYGKRGVWAADNREIQTEPLPDLIHHDYVIRVRKWSPDHRPLEIEGYYVCESVTQDSLRTGNRFGQYEWDTIGQRAQVNKLQVSSEPITRYPVLGVRFDRLDGKVR